MKLAKLVERVAGAQVRGDLSTPIRGLAYHTRDVGEGTLFFCIPGLRADGHEFAARAAAAGAGALVCEHVAEPAITQVIVPSARRALAQMAACWYGDPSCDLTVTGVTGTNGKTTTAHLVAGIAAAAGRRSALLGTVVNRIGGRDHPVLLTTAESLELQRMFREMVVAGDQACVLEVSSHALALDRAVGIAFDAVVFTNLTRDHLDFHRDLDDYFLAKRRLFLPDEARNGRAVAIVNVGDAFGGRLAEECRPAYGDDLWTFVVAEAALASAEVPAARAVERSICVPMARRSPCWCRASASRSGSPCAWRRASTSRTLSRRPPRAWPWACRWMPCARVWPSRRACRDVLRPCAPVSGSA